MANDLGVQAGRHSFKSCAPDSPSFSVIIPTYGSGNKLEASIQSVLSQEWTNLECLVFDGEVSAATTKQLADMAANNRSLRWWSQPDDGVYDAMNNGIRAATGDYLYFLGAGDTLRPGVLSEVARLTAQFRFPEFVYGDVFWKPLDRRYAGAFSTYKMLQRNICHQAIFYHRSLFARLGSFDRRFPVYADYHFNLRCFGDRAVRKRYVDLVIADYEGGGISDRPYCDPPFLDNFSEIVRETMGTAVWQTYVRYKGLRRFGSRVYRLPKKMYSWLSASRS